LAGHMIVRRVLVPGQLILLLIIIAFGLYIGFRVWRSLKNERKLKK